MGRHGLRSDGHFSARGLLVRVTLLSVIAGAFAAAGGYYAAHWLRSQEESSAPPPPPASLGAALFRDWPSKSKPEIVLVLSGQEHGYLQPCGCSKPQLGGLARRWNFLQSLKARGWPTIVPLDLGDIFDEPKHRGPQATLKYQTSMDALKLMGYSAVAVGQFETASPTLIDVLGAWALNYEPPVLLAANLIDKEVNALDKVHSGVLGGNGKVGVIAIIGPTVAKTVPAQGPVEDNKEPPALFAATPQVLPAELKKLQDKYRPELLVLLYQGTVEEARSCAGHFPQLNVILCQSRESEPSDRAERVGDTLIISVGHKGRFVGVVGAYRTKNPKQPFDLRYQLAALGEEYETPKGKEKTNPVMELMEKYAREVKESNYLAQYGQRKHPLQVAFPEATYVGSARCGECHERAYEVWKKSGHAHAYHSLETATRPGLRQYDGECVVCHVVGFGHQGGFTDEKATAKLKDVGCESCHGPGSLHANGNKSPKMLAEMNPFKERPGETPEDKTRRLNLLDQSCQQCHDQDNDVHWDFNKKWPLIAHPEQ